MKNPRTLRRYQRSIIRGVLRRIDNGMGTQKDVDFITRMQREAKGMNGYSHGGDWAYHRWDGNNKGDKDKGGVKPTKEEGVFCVESNEVTAKCPIATVPDIYIPGYMWDIFHRLTEEYDTEWIALLKGKIGSNGDYTITSFYFPPQTATRASVDVPISFKAQPGTIAAIHSHVGMEVFFSGTDTSHSNWPVEIVMNRKKNYKAIARHKLKCGEYAKNEAKVYLIKPMAPIRLINELNKAFELGEVEEKAAAAKSAPTSSTPFTFPNTTPQLPYPSSTDSKGRDYCHNGHKRGGATYFCVFEKGHQGRCKDRDSYYFDPDTPDSPSAREDQCPKCFKPMRVTTFTKGEESGLARFCGDCGVIIKIAAGKDVGKEAETTVTSTGLDDLEDEDLCANCGGTGYQDIKDRPGFAENCDVCKGDGLSVIGRTQRRIDEELERGDR